VERIMVFAQAVGAERETSHGRSGAVVGDAGDDAVAGTAVGAGYERVTEAPVGRIEQLLQAVGAEGGIGGDLDVGSAGSALENRKGIVVTNGNIGAGMRCYESKGGEAVPEQFLKNAELFVA